jgi:hypothetical protein
MPQPPLSDEKCQEAINALAQHGGIIPAARALDLNRSTFEGRIREAKRRGFKANVGEYVPPAQPAPPPPSGPAVQIGEALLALLRRSPSTLDAIAEKLSVTRGQALDTIDALQRDGSHIVLLGDRYTISAAPEPAFMKASELPTYCSRPDGTYVFGACGDNHIGSKYARLDVLNEIYDIYAEEGVDRVFNTGNWIDGEASFNQHDLLVHGMDNQLRALAKDYPQRKGIETYAVAGDDHEGWYAQKFGIDIGMRAQHTMRDAGRTDWHNLGYMEAHVRLVNSQSGAESILAVVHPGGGSSYAVSYSIQKIIESLDGGEKPAVGLYGHYHKLWAGNIRNVWCVQTGTTEDQTPFMRKKKLEAHVGATLLKLRQDPKTGAITRCSVELLRFFNRGFYNGRWNHGSDVAHAVRTP